MKRKRNIVTDPNSPLYNKFEHLTTCINKKSYSSYWQAKYAANEFYKHNPIILNAYQCPFCHQWHLTHEME